MLILHNTKILNTNIKIFKKCILDFAKKSKIIRYLTIFSDNDNHFSMPYYKLYYRLYTRQ